MRLKSLAIVIGLALFSALTAWPAMALELKFGHYAAETHPGHKATLMFAEAVKKRTNGEITVKIYPNNALGSPPEVLEQNKLGAIDMSLPTQGALDKYVKEFSVVMLPFVYDDYEHCWRVLDGPFMEWTAPKLAGQNADYAFNQMKDIKSGARSNGQTAAMKGVMGLVSEEEMRAIADWLAAQ